MKKMIAAAALVTAAAGVQAQTPGIPTSDAGVVIAVGRQTVHMVEQVQTLRYQLESMTGNRGAAAILYNPLLQRHIPQDIKHIYNAGQSIQYGGYSGALEEISRVEVLTGTADERRAKIAARQAHTSMASKAIAQESLAVEHAELDNINLQIDQIMQTNDPKGIAEVQAALAASQARISARSNQYALLTWMGNNEQALLDNQRAALDADLLDPSRRSMPRLRLWSER